MSKVAAVGGGDEDRRASIVSNTDQVKSVTEELKRLNDYFELQQFKGGRLGLLSPPGSPLAAPGSGGGVRQRARDGRPVAVGSDGPGHRHS